MTSRSRRVARLTGQDSFQISFFCNLYGLSPSLSSMVELSSMATISRKGITHRGHCPFGSLTSLCLARQVGHEIRSFCVLFIIEAYSDAPPSLASRESWLFKPHNPENQSADVAGCSQGQLHYSKNKYKCQLFFAKLI